MKSQSDIQWLKDVISNKNSYNSELEETNQHLENMISKQKSEILRHSSENEKLLRDVQNKNDRIAELERSLQNKRKWSEDTNTAKILHPNFTLTRRRFDSTCSDSDVQVRPSNRSLSEDD